MIGGNLAFGMGWSQWGVKQSDSSMEISIGSLFRMWISGKSSGKGLGKSLEKGFGEKFRESLGKGSGKSSGKSLGKDLGKV